MDAAELAELQEMSREELDELMRDMEREDLEELKSDLYSALDHSMSREQWAPYHAALSEVERRREKNGNTPPPQDETSMPDSYI